MKGAGKSYSVVGKSVTRLDAIEKVTGKASFVADIVIPGMLYGKILRSPYAHAKIVKIDKSKAEKLLGVRAILTYEDVPEWLFSAETVPGVVQDMRILNNPVRYVGEPVAAVAATNLEIAEEALSLIKVKYEKLAAVFDPVEAMKPNAPQLHADKGVENNIAHLSRAEKGDVKKGFAEADLIIEGVYKPVSRQCHCCLETHVAIASWDPAGNLTVWSSCQDVYLLQRNLSKAFNMRPNKIRVIAPYVGGGFGSKDGDPVIEPLCAALAKKAGRPVKLELDREEEFATTRTRHPMVFELKVGVKKEGTLTAVYNKVVADTGSYGVKGPLVTAHAGSMGAAGPYRCPNKRWEAYCVYTNNPVAGSYQGFGGPQAHFALEILMDEVAEKLNMDPVEFRLKNVPRVGDEGPFGPPILSCGLEECIRRGAERIGWKEWWKSRPKAEDGKKLGMGMACLCHVSGAVPFLPETSSAIIKLNEDGTGDVQISSSEIGTGSRTAIAQIVAEELGLCFEDVHVFASDTTTTPYGYGTAASRTIYVAGGAALMAARDAKQQLLKVAGMMLNVTPERLEVKDGRIYVKTSPETGLTVSEAIVYAHGKERTSIIGRASHRPAQAYTYAAQFAEVEVELETGKVKVLRMVAAHDVGKAINPSAIEVSLQGSIVTGIGYTLTENLLVENGKPLNPSFTDYKVQVAPDIPKIEIIIVESRDPTGPFGAKGVGEPGFVPTAPAIANAIYDAIGIRFRELPITPIRVLKALKKRKLQK